MTDQFSPDSTSFTAALAALVVALRQMYAKRLFQIFGVNIRLLPLLVFGWIVALLISAVMGPPDLPGAILLMSVLAVPSIAYFWQVGNSYCQLLGIRHPLGFWQFVGIGLPVGYLTINAMLAIAKWSNTLPRR